MPLFPDIPASPTRTVFCEDAISWLEHFEKRADHSFVTSLPDISEFPGYSLEAWKNWFIDTAALILSRTADSGVAVFYQSDIKVDGTWIDKAYLCQKAAEASGYALLWHKIFSRIPPGTPTAGRPAYSHALCFSKELRLDPKALSPDVLADIGDQSWNRGMGLQGCLVIGRFIAEHTATKTVVNPFCGQGSMLAAANALGLSGIGIERSPKRAEIARVLAVSGDFERWENFES